MELLNRIIQWFQPKPEIQVTMNWRTVPKKYVLNRKGTFFSLTDTELQELKLIIKDIESNRKQYFKEDARKT